MEKDLEELAKKRVRARMGLIIHASIYAVMNLGMFLIWFTTGRGYPWFLWPLFGWGIGLAGHAVSLAVGPGSAAEQRAIDKELRRLREAH